MRRPTNKQAFLKYLLRTRSALKKYNLPQNEMMSQFKQVKHLDAWTISQKLALMDESQTEKSSIDLYYLIKSKSPTWIQKGSFVVKNSDGFQSNQCMIKSHSNSMDVKTKKQKMDAHFEINGKELPLIKQNKDNQKTQSKRYKFFKDKSVQPNNFPMFENIRLKQSLDLKRHFKTQNDETDGEGEKEESVIIFQKRPKLSILNNELSVNKVVLNVSRKQSQWMNSRRVIKNTIRK